MTSNRSLLHMQQKFGDITPEKATELNQKIQQQVKKSLNNLSDHFDGKLKQFGNHRQENWQQLYNDAADTPDQPKQNARPTLQGTRPQLQSNSKFSSTGLYQHVHNTTQHGPPTEGKHLG